LPSLAKSVVTAAVKVVRVVVSVVRVRKETDHVVESVHKVSEGHVLLAHRVSVLRVHKASEGHVLLAHRVSRVSVLLVHRANALLALLAHRVSRVSVLLVHRVSRASAHSVRPASHALSSRRLLSIRHQRHQLHSSRRRHPIIPELLRASKR
jgi:hypothetical protein